MDDDPRIAMITDALGRMVAGDRGVIAAPAGIGDGLDALIGELNRLSAAISANELRFDEMLDVISAMASRDFSHRARVEDAGTIIDAMAVGVNMLSEELAAASQAQAAALAELSTPLIPISDTVVVMPLIGAVDARRAQQVLEALLEGIGSSGADVAILDITGVPVVDTMVANGLIQAAQAARLLGATVMLTGIRPEVAQTLVGLGVDLRGIVTHSTLQSGIAAVLRTR
jgi:anti-anti-sigma regulatory factor